MYYIWTRFKQFYIFISEMETGVAGNGKRVAGRLVIRVVNYPKAIANTTNMLIQKDLIYI
jgi:hypothetical protein